MKRNFIGYLTTAAILFLLVGQPARLDAEDRTEPSATGPAFYAFCFDSHDANQRSLEEQAAMLKRLGFDGAGHVGLENIQQRVVSLKAAHLRLFLAGIRVDLKNDASVAVHELRQAIPVLQNQDVLLYVVLAGLPTADAAGTPKAISVMRELAAVAAPANVRLGIYPHTSDWVARVDHAVRVAEAVERDNVGVIFNLCHWLRNEEIDQLQPVLTAAGDRLFGVTINGAELAGKDDKHWNRLIQPLDQGDFDVARLLALLDQVGYEGPIGLMCYGLGGDAAAHLDRSMTAWQKLRAK